MDNTFKTYYSSGEFAKLCGVNKKTLFHYDTIGLLKPEKITSNGYRYYSAAQLDVFGIIAVLKEFEMPLSEIKTFLDTRTPDKAIELFTEEKLLIEKQIAKLKRMQSLLDIKLEIIREGKNSSNDIFIEEQSEERLILSNKVKETNDEYDINTYSEHIKFCIDNNLSSGYPIGAIFTKEQLLKGNFNIPYCYFTKISKTTSAKEYVKKPKGLYVVAYNHGYYNTTHILYKSMIDFITSNNLNIIGNSYEEVLIDEVATNDKDSTVIKISILCSYGNN